MLVLDSVVDIFFFIDIVFNFHTSFVGNNGEVITDETKIRKHYLKVSLGNRKQGRKKLIFCFQSGFVIDIMACLPYDLLHNFIGTSYTDIFSILKVTKSLEEESKSYQLLRISTNPLPKIYISCTKQKQQCRAYSDILTQGDAPFSLGKSGSRTP